MLYYVAIDRSAISMDRVSTVGYLVKSYTAREADMAHLIDKFALVTPAASAFGLTPRFAEQP
jgi:hypothetical protein